MIDFIENGNVFLNGSKVAEASNGFTFDVPSQTIVFDGESLLIEGLNLVLLNIMEFILVQKKRF